MYHVGTSGWSYNHWHGRFYPSELDRGGWLDYFAQHFNTVEVNMTFYRLPSPGLLKGWYQKTPPAFKFSLKGSRLITHIKKLKATEELVKGFYRLAETLQEKLGCVLWQMPPSLKLNLELLEGFLRQLPRSCPNVIEFRHKSWYVEEVYQLLKEYQTAFCIVSAPRLPADTITTSPTAYVRFHGVDSWYRYHYSDQELAQWAERIKGLPAEDCFVYFNNDFQAYAVKNAISLRQLLPRDE